MATKLSIAQKKQLVEHKANFEKDGGKMPFKDQLAYCQKNFNESPSSTDQQNLVREREVVEPQERRQPESKADQRCQVG
jgi:hypothetical protein